jgi:hypothetical protein
LRLIILFIAISSLLVSFTNKEKNPYIGDWQMKLILLRNDTIFLLSKPEYTIKYYKKNLSNGDTSAAYLQEIEKKSMALYQSFAGMRHKITSTQIQPYENNSNNKQNQNPVNYQLVDGKIILSNTPQSSFNYNIVYLKKENEIVMKHLQSSLQMVNIYSKIKR